MVKITQNEAKALRESRFGKFVTVINKTHGSKAKTYYVIEDPKVKNFLKKYREKTNLGVSTCVSA